MKVRVIDFETTGTEPPAEVIEAGYCDLVHDEMTGWLIDKPKSWLCGAAAIPPETRAVHHISPEDIDGLPPFDARHLLANDLSVIAAHSMEFEAQWLAGDETPPKLCTYKAALRVWPDAPSHSNGALRYWLQDLGLISPVHELTMPPHRAGPDAYVTAHILRALIDTGVTGKEMVAWTLEPAVLPRCPIGEWRGRRWSEVDDGFLRWMINKPVEPNLVWNAQRELDRRHGHV